VLVHKSVYVRPEVWQKLKLNALASGVSVRDYLSLLIEQAAPVDSSDRDTLTQLDEIVSANAMARRMRSS
jgi:hypothetical protein